MRRTLLLAGLGWGLALAPMGAAGAQEDLAGVPVDSVAAAEGASPSGPAISGPIRLEVSVSERVLRVISGDAVVKSYPVAVGKSQHPTPRGRFQIRRMIWNPRWVPPNAAWARGRTAKGPGDPGNPMGRVKLFFHEPDYYIHGTEAEESLGTAASHGCVRMSNDDVVELARLVMEHGGQPRPQSWFQRILSRVRTSSEVRLDNPVTVMVVG